MNMYYYSVYIESIFHHFVHSVSFLIINTAKKSDYRTGKYGSYKYLYISYWATSVQNKFLYIHCISSFFGLICMPFNEFDHL